MSVLAADVRRDARIIGLIGVAHFSSHFFQLSLAPVFPLIRDGFGVSYTALGLIMSVFYGASGVGQTVAGFLVDRFGAARVLVGGLALLAVSVAGAGLAPSYWALVVAALCAGLGNSVFHPADYAIFNGSVATTRIGRAYSVHSVLGNLGWASAPVVIVALSAAVGWRGALVIAGAGGLVVAALLAVQAPALGDHRVRQAGDGRRPGRLGADVRMLLVAPILSAFGFFALLAMALIGLQQFAATALTAFYGVPLTLATAALTGFLLGNAGGILVGGVVADRTRRHEGMTVAGLLAAAAVGVTIATGIPPAALLPVVMSALGFCMGFTAPSRDLIVRGATPAGASGKVFGFVYSGLDLGSSLTPLLFGWLLDRGEPRLVFVAAGALLVAGILPLLKVRRPAVAAPARA